MHTLPAAVAKLQIYLSHVLGAEHVGNATCYGGLHGTAIRAVTVTNPPDEWRHKRPNGMAEAFSLILPEILQGCFLRQFFQAGSIQAGQVVHVNFLYYLEHLPFLWRQTHSVAETLFSAEINVTAITGKPYYAADKTEDSVNILNRQDLPVM